MPGKCFLNSFRTVFLKDEMPDQCFPSLDAPDQCFLSSFRTAFLKDEVPDQCFPSLDTPDQCFSRKDMPKDIPPGGMRG